MNKSPATRTLSIALFLFTLYTHGAYIGAFASTGNAFVTSSVVAMLQLALTVVAVWAAFIRPRLFWMLCLVFFLSYPISVFLLQRWYPDVIYVEDPMNYPTIGLNLGIPVLLLLLSAATYFFAYRKEHAV
jgi:hypothetical protein